MAITRTSKEFNPGGARWCDEHGRLECTKNRTKARGTCHQAAVRGTSACKNHAGYSSAVIKAQGQARITAWNPNSDKAPTIDAASAVLSVLQMTYLRLGLYADLLRRQIATEGEKADDPASEDEPNSSGLIGYRYGAAGKDGTIYVQSEEVRALVILEASERDKVVKYAKTAHDMGISEKLTAMAEQWGDIVAGRVSLLLADLHLTPDQTIKVPSLLQAHLGSIDMAAIEGL
jgi:hypothetical protein